MQKEPIVIGFSLGDEIRISPPLWPDHKLEVEPGDLTQFAPFGNGVYGYQEGLSFNPILTAPPQEASGGVIYFGNDIEESDLSVLLKILGVRAEYKGYAVFTEESKNSEQERYLVQVRLISKFGLSSMFGALKDKEYDSFPEQKLTVKETLWAFIQKEKERWGTDCFTNKGLYGRFGGDGDWVREELCFGFMVENEYFGIYRIWSRAWLVTK